MTLNAENLLRDLLARHSDETESPLLGKAPEFATLSIPRRQINVEHLLDLLKVTKQGDSIEILYQSLTRITPKWRWIAPHAFATDGFRWHVRAFCFKTNSFRDFVLGRILETRNQEKREVDFSEDESWNTWVEVKIGPHPGLTDDQQKIIAQDYGMQDGALTIKVRQSMILYLLVELRVDDEQIEGWRNPDEQQIVLLNREELMPMLPP